MFIFEEFIWFGFGCFGSRVMVKSGKIFDIFREVKDLNNVIFVDVVKEVGYIDVEEKFKLFGLEKGVYLVFVEFYIE